MKKIQIPKAGDVIDSQELYTSIAEKLNEIVDWINLQEKKENMKLPTGISMVNNTPNL